MRLWRWPLRQVRFSAQPPPVPGLDAALAAEQYKMVSIPKLRAPWFNEFEKGLQKAGKDFGVNVYQQAPKSADEALQVRLISDAINQGVNALLVVPNDAQSIVPVLAKAQAQKIVTLTHELPQQKNADVDIEMIDNKAFGEKSIDLLAKAMGKPEGQYAIYVGSLTVPAHNIWADAALARAKQMYPDLKPVARSLPGLRGPERRAPDRARHPHRASGPEGLPLLRQPGRAGRRPGGRREGADRQGGGGRHDLAEPGGAVPEGWLDERLHPVGSRPRQRTPWSTWRS